VTIGIVTAMFADIVVDSTKLKGTMDGDAAAHRHGADRTRRAPHDKRVRPWCNAFRQTNP
jgi:hypothetical protein